MPFLIDGHNLIGHMPDLSIDDPADERKLSQRVRRYCRRHRRRATIIFDAGLPGGHSRTLSSPRVEVVFASSGTDADRLLCRRIRRARDPRGLIVVSSDREVQAAARARGARVMAARAFAARLAAAPSSDETEEEKPLVEGDVEEWLHVFEQE